MTDTKTSAVTTDTALGIADYFVGVQDIGGTPATVKYAPKVARSKIVVTVTQSATPTWNTDNGDVFIITGLAANITSLTTNLSGTPKNKEVILLEVTDDGTGRTIAPGASFVGTSNNTLTGLTTVASKKLMLWWMWSSALSKWELVHVDQSL